MLQQNTRCAVALLTALAAARAAVGATYHVAPAGDDANAGSADAPWRSIAKANATLRAGDTALLHAGVYTDTIRPLNDGDGNDARIVYRAFGDGEVRLHGFSETDSLDGGALALGGKRYVTVSGRAAGDPADARRIRLEPQRDTGLLGNVCGSEGVVVEHVRAECPSIDRSCSRGIAFCLNYWPGSYESKYNVLRHSTLIGFSSKSDSASDYTEDLVTIAHRAHHNLIENNVLMNVRHAVLYADSAASHSNVVRNNVIRNLQHTALSIWSAGIAEADGARFLVENNYLEGSGRTAAPDGGPGSPLQWGSDELIVRYNVITGAGGADVQNAAVAAVTGATSTSYGQPYFATDGRLYNNTIVKNRGVGIGIYDFGVDPVDLGRHVFVNNIVYDSRSSETGKQLIMYWDGRFDTNDRYIANVIGNPGDDGGDVVFSQRRGAATVTAAAATFRAPADPEFTPWHGFENVYDAAPGFRDYAGDDFRLRPASRYVDAGAPLTRVAADDAGGAQMRVEDARFFYAEAGGFPAWMNVGYDTVAVGATLADAATAQLAGVDDATATLTLAQALPRRPGDFVWLWRDSDGSAVIRGAAPDIGAFESEGVPPPTNFRIVD